MITGRPTEYRPEFCDKVDEYLLARQDESRANGKITVNLPTIEDFALFIGVSKRSLYDWEKQHPDFLHALDKIRSEQQRRLIDRGLSGDYNSTIAKLVLSANHGMREKSDVTSDDQQINTEVLVRFINEPSADTNTN